MSDPVTVSVTLAGPSDVPSLSRSLARAFHTDPVFKWVVPDPSRRRHGLPGLFAAFVDLYLPYRATYFVADGDGAALWAPPGSESFAEDELSRFGERLGQALGDDTQRALELGALLDEYHPAESCFYLQFMGVTPEQQGRGLGSQLLTTVLKECDARGTPAYLEATSPDNRRLYQRHGFQVTTEIELPQGPSLWAMWRQPTPH